ncbi:MAG TPA: hypothetical protein IAA06_07995 [Candidatus Blautia faecavium]|uniref:YcxB-like protein domain-containing protein n=1 Tax=Candidatus Blautia faecavium TaxID=2838487 RepID=A0A9D2LT85_9FIRM|nr:hypothetical protein [Candidatus Blautia faecavium]
MRKTEFKVHTIYSREDILQMEKVSGRKMRHLGLGITGAVFILYLAVVLWEVVQGDGHACIFPFISGGVLDVVLLAILAICFVMIFCMPYLQRHKILKDLPGGVLKANYYFYERTFQYGWGETFTTVGYVEIQEFISLPNSFYIKAKDVSYWVKKSDFQVGTPEEFLEFMKGKVKCKVIEKTA